MSLSLLIVYRSFFLIYLILSFFFFFLAWFFGLFGLFEALTIRILYFTFWFCLHSNQRLDLKSHPFKAFLFYKLLLNPLTSLLQWYVISQPRIHDIYSWLTWFIKSITNNPLSNSLRRIRKLIRTRLHSLIRKGRVGFLLNILVTCFVLLDKILL